MKCANADFISKPFGGYDKLIKNFLSPKGHQNQLKGLQVMAIILKGLILPIGGASAVEGLQSTGLPCLVFLICPV